MKKLKALSRFHHEDFPVRVLASPSGELVVSTEDGIYFWDPKSKAKKPRIVIREFDEGVHQAVSILDVSRDGKFLCTGSADFTTKVFSTETGEMITRLSKRRQNYYNSAEQIHFMEDGKLLVTVMGRSAEVFRVGDWEKLHDLKGHTSKMSVIDQVPGSKRLITAAGKYVKLWDVAKGTELYAWPAFPRAIADVGVSQDGKLLATSTEGGEVDLWTLPKGKHLLKYADHHSEVFGLKISPDKSLIASSEMADELHLWQAADGKLIAKLPLECSETIAFSPDGKYVAGANGSEVWLVETAKGTQVASLGAGSDLVFLDEKRLASLDGEDAVIWDLGR